MSHYSAVKESGPTALLFINKHARNGDSSARYVKQLLLESRIHIIEPDENASGSCSDIIRAYADRVDFVIIGGGDGTLNSAAPGTVDTGLPLGVLPLGTANDFARTVGIPREIRQAVQVIVDGQRRAVDLGEVNGHLFLTFPVLGFLRHWRAGCRRNPRNGGEH